MLRSAHAVWLLRRATILDGISADAGDEPRDPARAAVFHRIVEKLSRAVDDVSEVTLTPEERAALVTEAHELTERAARELRRAERRDLLRGEEWLRTAQALRELAEATRH